MKYGQCFLMKCPRVVGENYSWRTTYISHVEESTLSQLSLWLKDRSLKTCLRKAGHRVFYPFLIYKYIASINCGREFKIPLYKKFIPYWLIRLVNCGLYLRELKSPTLCHQNKHLSTSAFKGGDLSNCTMANISLQPILQNVWIAKRIS